MAEGKSKLREKLEVPPVAPLERKLANLTRERPDIGPAPRSAVLGKLAAFLPQLAQENEKLAQEMQDRPQADFDIEHVQEDGASPYIEMDLTCGVLELRDGAALRAAERAMAGQEPLQGILAAGGAGGSSSDDEDSSDDDEEGEEDEDDSSDSEGGSGVDPVDLALRALQRGAGGGGLEGGGPGPGSQGGGSADEAGEDCGDGAAERMECENDEGARLSGKAGTKNFTGRGRRKALGVKGKGAGGAALSGAEAAAGVRRKVATKRSKFIEELS